MPSSTDHSTVNIAPGVSMLSVLQSLNYKPWYALAEFVDNAIQSAMDDAAILSEADGQDFALHVRIRIGVDAEDQITITDNAGGIRREDFGRAFKPAALPPDRSGLSEFGMGMKSAACWFSPRWRVTTTSPGAYRTYVVSFDIDEIVASQVQEIDILEENRPNPSAHFTRVDLLNVRKMPQGRTLGKIKDHLTDIYRVLLRCGQLVLELNGERLEYCEPKVMKAPHFADPSSEALEWRKSIDVQIDDTHRVTGFAALLDRGSTSRAGFSLFRRGRVIQGSGDENYRPVEIFGQSNTYIYQRLFGELHLEGFEVSHTKDAFQWGESEEPFLELLRDQLDAPPLPLLRQAREYRKLESGRQQREIAQSAIDATSTALERSLPTAVAIVTQTASDAPEAPDARTQQTLFRDFTVHLDNQRWDVSIEVSPDLTKPGTLYTRDVDIPQAGVLRLTLRLNSAHPFVVRFGQQDSEGLEAILRMTTASAIGEYLAKMGGVRDAHVVARRISDVLTHALSDR